jgi:hypothetical protein
MPCACSNLLTTKQKYIFVRGLQLSKSNCMYLQLPLAYLYVYKLPENAGAWYGLANACVLHVYGMSRPENKLNHPHFHEFPDIQVFRKEF